MKITIKRTNLPEYKLVFLVDGEEYEWGYQLSRKLTGATCEDGNFGALTGNDNFTLNCGEHKREFACGRINFKTDSLESISAELTRRVNAAREWIATIPAEETIIFEV